MTHDKAREALIEDKIPETLLERVDYQLQFYPRDMNAKEAATLLTEFRNLLAALRTPDPVAVEVKALEWNVEDGWWQANGYRVEAGEDGRFYARSNFASGLYATFESASSMDEAKAAAQADYERRIRSALTTPPEPVVTWAMPPWSGPVPAFECPFHIGQAVKIAVPQDGDNPEDVFFVTGINWEHRPVLARGWNITIASREDIEKGYGQTDGYGPDDLAAALAVKP